MRERNKKKVKERTKREIDVIKMTGVDSLLPGVGPKSQDTVERKRGRKGVERKTP